mmetsp:Transcript_26625/g.53197  ORF Transcript_26625/g.53197 Transcript_26625/m.53197 type:complete len:113 (-) Transcript_26625:310-648(-)
MQMEYTCTYSTDGACVSVCVCVCVCDLSGVCVRGIWGRSASMRSPAMDTFPLLLPALPTAVRLAMYKPPATTATPRLNMLLKDRSQWFEAFRSTARWDWFRPAGLTKVNDAC